MMEEIKLNLKLPYVENDIIEHYNKNHQAIKETLLKVLGRNMDDDESQRLKRICMEYAIEQVTIKYQDELGIKNKESDE